MLRPVVQEPATKLRRRRARRAGARRAPARAADGPARLQVTGVDALTLAERRVCCARGRARPHQPRHRPAAVRDREDGRAAPTSARIASSGSARASNLALALEPQPSSSRDRVLLEPDRSPRAVSQDAVEYGAYWSVVHAFLSARVRPFSRPRDPCPRGRGRGPRPPHPDGSAEAPEDVVIGRVGRVVLQRTRQPGEERRAVHQPDLVERRGRGVDPGRQARPPAACTACPRT